MWTKCIHGYSSLAALAAKALTFFHSQAKSFFWGKASWINGMRTDDVLAPHPLLPLLTIGLHQHNQSNKLE